MPLPLEAELGPGKIITGGGDVGAKSRDWTFPSLDWLANAVALPSHERPSVHPTHRLEMDDPSERPAILKMQEPP